jgi:hypothetical protein
MAMILRRLVFALSLVIGALASQLPEFAQQYRQRLGGAIDELAAIVQQFDADARAENLTRDAALDRLQANADPLASKRATAMRGSLARLDRLSEQQEAFSQAGPFMRLGVMARDFDPGVAQRAWQAFEPALPITSEGIVSGLLGFILGGGLLRMLAWPFTRRKPTAKPRAA